MSDLTSFAGSINRISHSLRTLGIDSQALQQTAAAFQIIGGTSQVLKGIINAKRAYNTAKAAWGTANLVKYGPSALVVGAAAVAGGVWIGQEIERHVTVSDGGEGLRLISGGGAFGRE